MAETTEQDYIARITDRLRRDHPDPKMRQRLYDEGGLPEYVQVLMREVEDPAVIERVTAGVRAAEDGQPAT
jgi:hypothetical protein